MIARWLVVALLACWTANVVSVERVIDGDTIVLELGIWPNLIATEHVRLLGVDTPEHKPSEEAWAKARAYTEAWLKDSGYTEVTGCKRDSFGRLLGVVRSATKGDLGSALLMSGNAVPFTK